MVRMLDQAIRNTKLVREQLKRADRPERPEEPDVPPPPPEDIPDLQRPTTFDWLCHPGHAVSAAGKRVNSSNSVAAAYREHMRDPAANGRFTAKVHGFCGNLDLAGGYNYHDTSVACWDNFGEWGDVDISIVGGDANASVRVSIGGDKAYGFLRRFAAHNVGIKGRRDSIVIRQWQDMGEFVLDECWFISEDGVNHENGGHFSKDFDRIIVHKFQNKGFKCSYHLFYTKGGGEIWCVDSDLLGGNRSGWQDRAESDWYSDSVPPTPRPHGRRMFIRNQCDGHGFNHPEHADDGGAVLSLYSSPDHDTILDGNVFDNCRYGAIYLIHRDDAYHTDDGFAHGKVVWRRNVCNSQNQQTDPESARPAVSISSVKRLEFETWPSANSPEGFADVVLNDPWSIAQGAPEIETYVWPAEPKPEHLSLDR